MIEDIGELRKERNINGNRIRIYTPVLTHFSPKIWSKKNDEIKIIEKTISPVNKRFL